MSTGDAVRRYIVTVPLVSTAAVVATGAVRLVVDPVFRMSSDLAISLAFTLPIIILSTVSGLVLAAPFWAVFNYIATPLVAEDAVRAALVSGPACLAAFLVAAGVIAPLFGAYGLRADLPTVVFAVMLLITAPPLAWLSWTML